MQKPKIIKVPKTNAKVTDEGLVVKVNDRLFLLIEDKSSKGGMFTVVTRKVFSYLSTCVAAKDEVRAKNLAQMGDVDEVICVFPGRLVPFWHYALSIDRAENDELKQYTAIMKIQTKDYTDHIMNVTWGKSAEDVKRKVEITYADSSVLFVYPGHHRPCWFKKGI